VLEAVEKLDASKGINLILNDAAASADFTGYGAYPRYSD
jgi:hypothetical protein